MTTQPTSPETYNSKQLLQLNDEMHKAQYLISALHSLVFGLDMTWIAMTFPPMGDRELDNQLNDLKQMAGKQILETFWTVTRMYDLIATREKDVKSIIEQG